MNVLIDTHVFIWLDTQTRKIIEKSNGDLSKPQ